MALELKSAFETQAFVGIASLVLVEFRRGNGRSGTDARACAAQPDESAKRDLKWMRYKPGPCCSNGAIVTRTISLAR
jgi:hypothetical protein